jgi:hypothetical protein
MSRATNASERSSETKYARACEAYGRYRCRTPRRQGPMRWYPNRGIHYGIHGNSGYQRGYHGNWGTRRPLLRRRTPSWLR